MQNFRELAARRHSSRRFDGNRVVDDADLQDILETALLAPSWSNTQPFRVAVATGDVKDKLKAEFTKRYDKSLEVQDQGKLGQAIAVMKDKEVDPKGEYVLPRGYPEDLKASAFATGKGLYDVLGIGRGDRDGRRAAMRKNFEFFDAPVALFVYAHEGLGVYGPLDVGFFLQTLALAATERGLSTCMQGALAYYPKPVRAVFDIPEHYKLLCGVSLGYESDEALNSYRPQKLAVDDLLLKTK